MHTRGIISKTDSYKVSHHKQPPRGTQYIGSYFEARNEPCIFFGLQGIIAEHFVGQVVSASEVMYYHHFFANHFGDSTIFNMEGWMHIVNDHDGKLPVMITAAPEGAEYPAHTPLFTIINTCPQCAWVTSYLETLLVQCWYPSTIATYSRNVKKVILNYLERTGSPEQIDFKLHDFGFRGSTSYESAAIGGAAHLLNFKGTDTLAGIEYINEFYDPGKLEHEMWGYSIPAAEHSTITSWGRGNLNEERAYRNMLTQFPGTVAVVSDSYDMYNAAANIWGKALREEVLAHDGTVVIRPDSGDPAGVCSTVIDLLGRAFGYNLNAKGFKVLPDKLRMIQGDGTDLDVVGEILHVFERDGWSADNIAFGMGGGLLQKHNRDDLGFTLKASVATIDGVEIPISKNPVTARWKTSKAGLQHPPDGRMVFMEGAPMNREDFPTLRARAAL